MKYSQNHKFGEAYFSPFQLLFLQLLIKGHTIIIEDNI